MSVVSQRFCIFSYFFPRSGSLQEIPIQKSHGCASPADLAANVGAGRFPEAQRSLRAAQCRRPNGGGAFGDFGGAAGQAKARETLVGCTHLGGDLDGAAIGWWMILGYFFGGKTVTEVFSAK